MNQSGRSKTVLAVVGTLLGALALGGVISLWSDREATGDGLATLQDMTERQEEVIDQLVENDEMLRDQLLEEDIEPSAPPAEEVVEDLAEIQRPDAAAVAPTSEQVEDAVAAVLEENPDLITSQVIAEVSRYLIENPPAPGEPGADATAEMAFAAVVAFCSSPDEPCRGEDGADAVVTPEMVTAALTDLCSTNPEVCQSTVEGPAGDAGRGVVSIDCVNGTLIATFDAEPFEQVIEGSSCEFPPRGQKN